MKTPTASSSKPLRGIAALFDDFERKQLFKKYLFLLGWIEILILAVCWLYQLGDGGHDHLGAAETSFPWRAYFLISFLAPVAITFIIGVVVVGFNRYFAEQEADGQPVPVPEPEGIPAGTTLGRLYKLNKLAAWVQQLPFLALLLLLGVAVGFFYKLDVFLGFVANVGEKSVKILLIFSSILVGLAAVFGLILIILNYQLRKRSMEYQYKSNVAERFGLIILEDNTVLNREGKLLVQGKKSKDAIPLLPADTSAASDPEPSMGSLPQPADLKVS